MSHDYLSTACYHDKHDQCRRECKFCQAPCRCSCHADAKADEAAHEAIKHLKR